ncbi:6-carboxytetrahydropterin synthase [Actinoallomurus sp. NBC_01490]|uniref:6-pyruvoyl trahydropterin synthase family protein n=1 Tax=Actinoallomurus sp. NBC_01490 TaxID=2903557 RepID=UPI002E366B6C|nr:6-carboxytetrahydropterin synthase [Actinoallomurus sp. NBC_01490]
MYEIAKRFIFSASHQLDQLPEGHKCRRLHGHNYTVVIRVAAGELDEYGFVVDFAELDRVGAWMRARFDHQHLNDVMDGPPTSERLAAAVFGWCAAHLQLRPGVDLQVRVAETDSTWAEYRAAYVVPGEGDTR